MSEILAIYNSIANMKVGSVPCRDIDQVQLLIKDADLPMRMLLPSTSGEMAFIAIGSLQNMHWAIRDLCFFAKVTEGRGIEHFSQALVEYLSLYLKQIKANRNPTKLSNIVGVEGQMGPQLWGDKEWYWAVDITVTVKEVL